MNENTHLKNDYMNLGVIVKLHPLAPTHVNFLLTMSLLTPAGDQLVVEGVTHISCHHTRIRSRERRK